MKVRLKDVAKLAGVSLGTASQTLNNKPCVVARTREKVLLAAKKLNYEPHAIARQLALSRTDLISCFLVPSRQTTWIHPSSWVFYYPIIEGILEVTSMHYYRLSLEIETAEDIRTKGLLLSLAGKKATEGAFFVLQVKDDYDNIFRLRSMEFPLVLINANISERMSSISVDNMKAARKAMQYLVSLGHQKIAFISGPMNHFNSIERLQGYKEILYESGLMVGKQWIVEGDWTIESGYECTGRILDGGIPTAIFSSNDHMAVGVMRRLKEAGLSVPEDVSVIGYDDSDLARGTNPSLSSVKQPLHEVGKLAAKELIRLIEEDKQVPRKVVLEAEIVKRESCATVR